MTTFLLTLLFTVSVRAEDLSAVEILQRIDRNMAFDQAIFTSKMVVSGRTGKRTIASQIWIKGDDKTLVEYLSPPREKGKKMLRVGNKLWTYSPEPNDRIITISGHLLRQSVMGSDLSYEDITDNSRLAETYSAELVGEEEISGRLCYVLDLTAIEKNASYYKRKIWVDKERWLPLKEDRFAKSGRLLKTTEIVEVFHFAERWYPRRIIFKDMLSKSGGTEYIIESIDLNVDIPDHMFTKAALRR
ncbi:outer membrane lipoprotein-sorting protein [candidate division LCP-89 bacterium B3_LCP]|uniref:Outer membrane lipoprotein-sorting protein n=1 Tax=candidate division LCP-89 bacterium B3_LCP TaxID=2012998 RepID=A0A532V290_UNCL8|nr:MAG: outer membrane lipoprotein-sorting protein [candidate division LCP-89 bacterium B3_LCP]